MMTMAAHQLGPGGAAMDAAAYQRAAAAAWYIDPASRAAGYTTNAAATADHGIGGGAGMGGEAHLGHNVPAPSAPVAPPPPPPGHPVGAAAPPPPDGSAAFFASSEASRYYQMHQAYENAATQGKGGFREPVH